MYQNTTLIQSLNDSKLAERRSDARSRRVGVQLRHGAAQRITRPLARLMAH